MYVLGYKKTKGKGIIQGSETIYKKQKNIKAFNGPYGLASKKSLSWFTGYFDAAITSLKQVKKQKFICEFFAVGKHQETATYLSKQIRTKRLSVVCFASHSLSNEAIVDNKHKYTH